MDVVAKSLPLGGPIFFFGMNPRGEGERTLEVASLMRFNGEIEFAGLEILYWKIRSPVLPIDDFPPGGCAVTGKKRTEDSPDMTHRSVIAIALVAPGACLSPPDERPQIVARYFPIALTGLWGVCARESYRQNTVIIRGERDRVPIVVLDHAPLGLKGSEGARFRLNRGYPGDQQSTNDELPKR